MIECASVWILTKYLGNQFGRRWDAQIYLTPWKSEVRMNPYFCEFQNPTYFLENGGS